MTLPPADKMLSMAGVGLDSPSEEKTKRMLNRDRKRPIAPMTGGPRKANQPSLVGRLKAPVA